MRAPLFHYMTTAIQYSIKYSYLKSPPSSHHEEIKHWNKLNYVPQSGGALKFIGPIGIGYGAGVETPAGPVIVGSRVSTNSHLLYTPQYIFFQANHLFC